MEYIKKVKLDINREYVGNINAVQEDTARYLLFLLYDNEKPYNLTGKTVRVYGLKPDGTKIFADCTITNISEGNAKLKLTNNMLAKEGKLKLMVSIYQGVDVVSTIPLTVNVIKTLKDASAIESSDEFTALDTALNKVDEWDRIFTETSNEIETRYTTRLNAVEKKIVRKFKPAFGIAQWWITKDTSTGRWKCVSDDRIKTDIDRFAEMGIEEMSLCIHASYDTSTKEWYMIHSGANALLAYNYCTEKGIKVNSLKFMVYDAKPQAVSDWSNFKTFTKTKINAFCSYLRSKGCEFDAVTVLNELGTIYLSSGKSADVIELLNAPKGYGYKSSLSLKNAVEFYQLPSTVRDTLDIICINLYPNVSYNGILATIEESIQCWERIVLDLRGIKQRYPEKEIMITETGCQDRWEALCNTGAYNWTDLPNTSNGDAPALFLKGLFESEVNEIVKSVTWWYYDSIYEQSTGIIYPQVDLLLREYIGGVSK